MISYKVSDVLKQQNSNNDLQENFIYIYLNYFPYVRMLMYCSDKNLKMNHERKVNKDINIKILFL